ncbi:hypothetical protein BZB76_2795 [Actinomadura pelletieri DSM 43383]|uniref:Uncharacterized protein n=1 Tax=Actinomadura pelletieri DSM 43383 TaxID=1120940 RepID=A0A495QMS7_9ACTN|nr:hypothetical protein [Actinomadura pelletieri]RKS74285.1 hypothetical protein BZB76_2795 [Actinomadura pelletieri DSM 43383]
MRDGGEEARGPGDAFVVTFGRDAWIVGDEPFGVFDFAGGMDGYAKVVHP